MTRKQRPTKIYREEVKDRQTSHWDWDYLPREQIDEVVAEAEPGVPETDRKDRDENWVERFFHAVGRLFGRAG